MNYILIIDYVCINTEICCSEYTAGKPYMMKHQYCGSTAKFQYLYLCTLNSNTLSLCFYFFLTYRTRESCYHKTYTAIFIRYTY